MEYCIIDTSKLPKENKFGFWDRVRYEYDGSNYNWCEWVVLEQRYHYCYGDYETKVNIKLQQWGYTDVWLWGNNLKKIED